jgi:hypothetical protein
MAISADKKNGKLTGRFRVEVQLHGKRLRARCKTIEEAREKEAELSVQLARADHAASVEGKDPHPHALAELIEIAVPMIWSGSSHGENARAKLARIADIVGKDTRLFDLSTSDVINVTVHLRENGKAAATINRYLSAFHRVLAWGNTTGRGYLPVLPTFDGRGQDLRHLSSPRGGDAQVSAPLGSR